MSATHQQRAAAGIHFHLPSIHLRRPDGTGFDFEEDLYFPDDRSAQEFEELMIYLDQRNTELQRFVENGFAALDAVEVARQARIAAGTEKVCVRCGCSETRACEGGCVWATATCCSRCAA